MIEVGFSHVGGWPGEWSGIQWARSKLIIPILWLPWLE